MIYVNEKKMTQKGTTSGAMVEYINIIIKTTTSCGYTQPYLYKYIDIYELYVYISILENAI